MSTQLATCRMTSTVKSSSIWICDDRADLDAALVNDRALREAGGAREVDAGLIPADTRREVREHEVDREDRDEAKERKGSDDCLSAHIGIGPTSLPCKNCWTIGLIEERISATVP